MENKALFLSATLLANAVKEQEINQQKDAQIVGMRQELADVKAWLWRVFPTPVSEGKRRNAQLPTAR